MKERGFTLIEVMMALTVLAIGMLGIVALQAATVSANQDAQQTTTASNLARLWIDRLQRDAARWNHPSDYKTSSDIGETAWLNMVVGSSNTWFRPSAVTTLEPLASPAFDRNGNDVLLSDVTGMRDNAIYCTHVRLRYVYPDRLIRAEVRVFWLKRRVGNPTLYAAHGLSGGICSTTDAEALGRDNDNFHWVYAVAAIPRNTAQ